MADKKWRFREDIVFQYINGTSSRTFQDAEDRLNYLEGKEQTLKLRIEQLLEELENETENRHMNDLEYGGYTTLIKVLDMFDEV